VAGSSKGTSLTGSSVTFNIFLLKINVNDLSTAWTANWGLDGPDQHDYAQSLALSQDGGKIVVVG